ncbi:unnamed protein product, partial [Effrenium voratum]
MRNGTVKLPAPANNQTDRHRRSCNGTCGVPAPWRKREIETPANMTAALEGPIRNSTGTGFLEGIGDGSSSSSSSARRRSACLQLQALVARGWILWQRSSQELADTSKSIARCERYFGGLSKAQ